MKKILFIIVALLIASSSNAFFKRFHMEINGGFTTLRMAEYNDDLSDTDSYYALLGFDSKLKSTTAGLILDMTLLAEVEKGWAFYLRGDYVIAGEDHNIVDFPDGKNYLSNFVNFDHFYTGLGVRKYFKDYWDVHMLRPFAAADAGVVFTVNNFMKSKFTDMDGSELAFIEEYIGGILFGACVEGGADYWISENAGFTGRVGYRVSLGKLKGKHRDSNVIGETDTEQAVDFSGIYVSIGMTFGF